MIVRISYDYQLHFELLKFFWPLCYLSYFLQPYMPTAYRAVSKSKYLRILITPLVSSNSYFKGNSSTIFQIIVISWKPCNQRYLRSSLKGYETDTSRIFDLGKTDIHILMNSLATEW